MLGDRGHRRVITCFIPLEPEPSSRTTIQFASGGEIELRHQSLNDFGAGIVDDQMMLLREIKEAIRDLPGQIASELGVDS